MQLNLFIFARTNKYVQALVISSVEYLVDDLYI